MTGRAPAGRSAADATRCSGRLAPAAAQRRHPRLGVAHPVRCKVITRSAPSRKPTGPFAWFDPEVRHAEPPMVLRLRPSIPSVVARRVFSPPRPGACSSSSSGVVFPSPSSSAVMTFRATALALRPICASTPPSVAFLPVPIEVSPRAAPSPVAAAPIEIVLPDGAFVRVPRVLKLPPSVRIDLATTPVDERRGIDSRAGTVLRHGTSAPLRTLLHQQATTSYQDTLLGSHRLCVDHEAPRTRLLSTVNSSSAVSGCSRQRESRKLRIVR